MSGATTSEADEDVRVRVATVIGLTIIIVTSIICMTFTAVLTDRDLTRVEILTFIATVMLTALGGVSFLRMWRHRRWRIRVEGNGHEQDEA